MRYFFRTIVNLLEGKLRVEQLGLELAILWRYLARLTGSRELVRRARLQNEPYFVPLEQKIIELRRRMK